MILLSIKFYSDTKEVGHWTIGSSILSKAARGEGKGAEVHGNKVNESGTWEKGLHLT
jgi:hypothetical protein